MTTYDPYQLTGDSGPVGGPSPDGSRSGAVRSVLWFVLVISLVGNMVASFVSGAVLVHLVCGVVAGASLIALAMERLRGRR